LDRPAHLPEKFRSEMGGLSGALLQDKSNQVIRAFYKETDGKLPIIGAGGVNSALSAYDKIKAGASLVQLYSALVYHGPNLANEINKGLVKLLKADGFENISEAIGAEV
jgi:dihydroorotate dehydrogenase